MTTRTLADKVERRINTLPDNEWNTKNGYPTETYERTLPNGYEIQWADGYAEPGYPSAEIVLLSNWNDESRYVKGPWREGPKKWVTVDATASRLADSLGKLDGVELGWSDEWAICDECNKCFRTSADSYSWTMSGVWNGDGYYCKGCALEDIDSFIVGYVNDADKAITWLDESDLEKAGWVKVENEDSYSGDYHNGWYGREDNPATIMSDIHDTGLSDVVFLIESIGQFECAFSPYVRAQEVLDQFGHLKSLIESAEQTVEFNAR